MKTTTIDKHDQHADHKSNQVIKQDDAKKMEHGKNPSNISEKKPTFPESKKSK